MDRISYLDIYVDINMIQYDYRFGENQAMHSKAVIKIKFCCDLQRCTSRVSVGEIYIVYIVPVGY